MSLKKDKFNSKDKFYMNLALNLAINRVGLTGTNPSVGCVIVKHNNIISLGQTSLNGRPHAEYNAVKNSKENLKGSTMYVSLEPCSHYGKTPPCTKLIIKNRIKKLYYAVNDVDKRSHNRCSKILSKKKIIVKKFLLVKKAKNLYKSYFFSKTKNLPYVVGKIACSKDNYIYTKSRIITNKHSRSFSHLLRYKNQAILTSSKTLNIDNSKLNCRLEGLESFSPIRFILDKNLILKKKSYLVKSAKSLKTYIFYNKKNNKKKNFLIKSGIKLIHSQLNKNNQFDLKNILKKISNIGINSLLVEGGAKLTDSFLKDKLFNEFYLFKSPVKLGKKGSIQISKIINKLPHNFDYKKKIKTFLDKDKVIYYY